MKKTNQVIKGRLIIGIAGKMGSGKDTIADHLDTAMHFKRMRFADALKDAACAIFGWRLTALEDQAFKAMPDKFWGRTPREYLQLLGTEACRNVIDQQIWVRSLHHRILTSTCDCIVIPDVRFENEAQAINDWGGYLIRVDRPGHKVTGATAAMASHSSETALDNYENYFSKIVNNASLLALRSKVDVVYDLIEDDYACRK